MIKSKIYSFIMLLTLTQALFSCGKASSPAPASTPTPDQVVTISQGAVTLNASAYGSNPLTVPVGTLVTWLNNDSASHSIVSDAGAFQSGQMDNNQVFSYRFATPGTYSYHCGIHGAQYESGVIVAQ